MAEATKPPQISPDDKWWWDGLSWRPIAHPMHVLMMRALDRAVIGMLCWALLPVGIAVVMILITPIYLASDVLIDGTRSVGRRYRRNRGQRCARGSRPEVRKTNSWRIVGWVGDHHGRVPRPVLRAMGRHARPRLDHRVESAPDMSTRPRHQRQLMNRRWDANVAALRGAAATGSGSGKGGIPSRTSIQRPPEGYRLILD